MCGICGILGKKTEIEKAEQMLSTLVHRGPDDGGIFVEDNIFMGHRRLSILDLSAAGHQPMDYNDYTIVFNGEIYNYVEIKETLIKLGHCFTTNTDTEVILHAYSEWHEDCFFKFRGMWAICIYDKKQKKVVLSRDRFGIKPLYYVYEDGCLLFASEIKSLLSVGIKRTPNLDRVIAYLMVDINEDRDNTFFEGIFQLPGGNNMIYDIQSHKISIRPYYELREKIKDSCAEEYKEEYLRVVKQYLRSDAKVGACLSGGLDSSTLAAVAQSMKEDGGNSPLLAVTAKSEDAANDECNYAEKVVDHCGLEWHIAYPTYKDFVDNHKEMLYIQEEPVGSPSIFMQFWVMKQAKASGVKVMLDGQGGDETLLGYERYYVSYLLYLLKALKIGSFVKAYQQIIQSSKLTMMSLLKYFVYFSVFEVRKLFLNKRMCFIQDKYKKHFFHQYKSALTQNYDILKLQIDEIMNGHLLSLLHYEDRNSMHFSIEARVPYIDHILLEKALGLKVNEKISDGWTKHVLREIADKFLPFDVAWRKNKYGFDAPEKKWLSQFVNEMQSVVNNSDILANVLTKVPDLRSVPLRERWRLYNVAIWESFFLK